MIFTEKTWPWPFVCCSICKEIGWFHSFTQFVVCWLFLSFTRQQKANITHKKINFWKILYFSLLFDLFVGPQKKSHQSSLFFGGVSVSLFSHLIDLFLCAELVHISRCVWHTEQKIIKITFDLFYALFFFFGGAKDLYYDTNFVSYFDGLWWTLREIDWMTL